MVGAFALVALVVASVFFEGRRASRIRAQAAACEGTRQGLPAFVTTFLLTLANPPTIMIFAAMFASLGLVEARSGNAAALTVVVGVTLGSASWWVLFAIVVDRMRGRLQGRVFVWVNRVSGAALAGFGLWALVRAGAVVPA